MNQRLGISIATGCSLFLTVITLTPPIMPTDWARLDSMGVYVASPIAYDWPSYIIQAILWVGMVGAFWATSRAGNKYKRDKASELQGWSKTLPYGNNLPTNSNSQIQSRTATHILWTMVFITLLGFGLRLYALDRLPLIIDEIGFAAHASDILHGQHVPIFAPGHNANPSVYSWLVAGAMAIFGQNAFAIRLMPMAFSTLSIPTVYLLGRMWWGRRVGLLAALFLATYPAHIFFSRMSIYNIVDPFFGTLALVILGRAVVTRSRHYFVLAGIFAGVAQYFYHGSRLVVVLMVVYIVAAAIRNRRDSDLGQGQPDRLLRVPNWGWTAITFGLVTLPRFAPMLIGGLPLTGNAEPLRLPADLSANSLRAILAWVGQADISPFWMSDAPLLEWSALIVFGIGIVVAARKLIEARNTVLIVSVILTTVFGGAIWTAAPLYVRYMTALPAIAMLVAIGVSTLSVIARFGGKWGKKRGDRPVLLIATIVIGLIGLQGVWATVVHVNEAARRVSESQWIEDDLARKAAALANGTGAVLIVPEDFGAVQRITIADYIAAYGTRRSIALIRPGETLTDEQISRLNGNYTIIDADHSPRK